MAETSEGKKKVYVHSHTKEDGTEVRTHYRSTPKHIYWQEEQVMCFTI